MAYDFGDLAVPVARGAITPDREADRARIYAEELANASPEERVALEKEMRANKITAPPKTKPVSYDFGDLAEPVKRKTPLQASEETKEPSWWDQVKRQVGLAVRAAGPMAVGAGAGAAMGAPLAGVGAIPGAMAGAGAMGITQLYDSLSGSDHIGKVMDYFGVPRPQNGSERVAGDITNSMANAGGVLGLTKNLAATARPMAGRVLNSMNMNPGLQIGSAAAGGGSGGVARESGAGPVGQGVAELAGSMALPGAAAGSAGLVRNLLRGGAENIPAIRNNMTTFKQAGTVPSVGQATENRVARGLENTLSKVPGGAGPMAASAEKGASDLGTQATKIADELSTVSSPSVAGRTIEKGISGPNGFVQRFKQGQKKLYDALDWYIPKGERVEVPKTRAALEALNADIPGAPNLSKFFKNAKMQGIEGALKADTSGMPSAEQDMPIFQLAMLKTLPYSAADKKALLSAFAEGKLPYEAVKKLRTLVGSELEGGNLTSDVPRSKWKALYAALSEDLDGAAAATGKKEAVQAMSRANRFSRAGYQRIEDVLDKVTASGIPENIFKSAVNPSDMQAGATKIASVMKSLQPAERDVVKSAFIRRMGQATAGNQGAEGDTFSSSTFLTNWNKMSPGAKSVMFEGGKLRSDLDAIAKVAENIREGSKVFANPSGTTQGAASVGLLAGVGAALGTGHLGTAAALLGAAGSANLTARLMTNPKFVGWLAKETTMSKAGLPAAIASLTKQIQDEPDGVKEDAVNYVKALTEQAGAQ